MSFSSFLSFSSVIIGILSEWAKHQTLAELCSVQGFSSGFGSDVYRVNKASLLKLVSKYEEMAPNEPMPTVAQQQQWPR